MEPKARRKLIPADEVTVLLKKMFCGKWEYDSCCRCWRGSGSKRVYRSGYSFDLDDPSEPKYILFDLEQEKA